MVGSSEPWQQGLSSSGLLARQIDGRARPAFVQQREKAIADGRALRVFRINAVQTDVSRALKAIAIAHLDEVRNRSGQV